MLKRNGTTIDTLQYEKYKIFDYLKAKGPKAIKKALDDINPAVRNEAKELKNILKESNTKVGNLLSKSKDESYQALAKVLISDADNFIKQRLASFNNPSFNFDPTSGAVGKAAKEHMKKLIKGNRTSKKDLAERLVKNP